MISDSIRPAFLADGEYRSGGQAVNLENNIVTNVKFLGGGCPGNLQALPRLVEGLTVEEINEDDTKSVLSTDIEIKGMAGINAEPLLPQF